uniref:Ubiquitin carboxyl-terminal hydrolase n=1 Tax=Marseillevirus LCMAC101 TaxID=2506602 RepID=A0A481YRJ2_9VIRU|nr:MAG: ubiquitin carboxyl-terminal hydrolase [Marseillevirus LCMAC101]
MWLYDYHEKVKSGPDRKKYAIHGELYQCMLRYFFGDVYPNHDLGIEKKGKVTSVFVKKMHPDLGDTGALIEPDQMGRPSNLGKFRNFSNSCFLDSMLMTILISDGSEYFRRKIFDSNIQNTAYSHGGVCTPRSKVKTIAETRELARGLRDALEVDYNRLLRGNVFKATEVRGFLARCDPHMRVRQESVTTAYGLIAKLFPQIQTYFSPKMVVRGDYNNRPVGEPIEKITLAGNAAFDVGEFIPQFRRTMVGDVVGEFYIWSEINHPIIVFQNNLGQYVDSFNEYILEGRYRLFSVITIAGAIPRPDEVGGGHYTSYIRIDNQWFYYNDSPPTLRRVAALPADVLMRSRDTVPELLFYERIREIPQAGLLPVQTEKEGVVFEPVEFDDDGAHLIVRYGDRYMGDVLRGLGARLKRRDDKRYANWILPIEEVGAKINQIENAVRIPITVAPQPEGDVMIFTEDKYGRLGDEFRNLGGTLVERDRNYYGLNYHLRDRGGVLHDRNRDYYWRIPRENFNDMVSRIQKVTA